MEAGAKDVVLQSHQIILMILQYRADCITHGDDAHQSLLLDNWQMADVTQVHQPQALLYGCIS